MSYFNRLAPFLQDYIYQKGWEELRDIQVAACKIIFETKDNLLLASGTASGKTEAAFLPILTLLAEQPRASVGCLYISPLKALINDQHTRLLEMVKEAEPPLLVTKWHGDANYTTKRNLLQDPQGILQTTPESLEAMLMRGRQEVLTLFSQLQFIVIDEVHYFMGEARGIHLLCLLERIEKMTGVRPRRIGLSATLGDYEEAARYLNMGATNKCFVPKLQTPKRKIRLSLAYFDLFSQPPQSYFQYLYSLTKDKKCILFTNSKAEVEESIAQLKKIAAAVGGKTKYFVHHANVSVAGRRYIEEVMRTEKASIVTGATVTLELGIDLGDLERIVQIGPPLKVSSFVQRLGRSGRKSGISEMHFAFRQTRTAIKEEFYQVIDWDMAMCIAIIQLYVDEKWIEPINLPKLPYGLLFHQTMSYLMGQGEASYQELKQNIFLLKPFQHMPEEDYQLLIRHLLSSGYLERSETGGFMPGAKGEREAGQYSFFSVFENPEEYSVKYQGIEIGTIQKLLPEGALFSLGGEAWSVEKCDKRAGTLFVKRAKGNTKNVWDSGGELLISTRIMKKIKEILSCPDEYAYMDRMAAEKLQGMRRAFFAALGDGETAYTSSGRLLFLPFLGTRELTTLFYALQYYGLDSHLCFIKYVPIGVIFEHGVTKQELLSVIKEIKESPLEGQWLPVGPHAVKPGKFQHILPRELIKKEYLEDYLSIRQMQQGLTTGI